MGSETDCILEMKYAFEERRKLKIQALLSEEGSPRETAALLGEDHEG